jgi:HAD superfamily hydrolase (TIGR01484 family)
VPEALRDTDPSALENVSRLFFDLDDTVTWRGQLPEVAARALYAAQAAGLSLVAVTGRSFSWAELFVRLFPVDAVIAETGACALVRTGMKVEVIHHEPDPLVRAACAKERDAVAARALREVPTARFAMDNAGRLYDTAFDLIEDGPPLSAQDAARIKQILDDGGLTTAQSSVHINAWKTGPHGPFDKASMADRLLRERFSSSLDAAKDTLCYVGDSKNDGSMFPRARVSVGVQNIEPHLPWLEARGQAPRYLVDGMGGFGFAQVVQLLTDARS